MIILATITIVLFLYFLRFTIMRCKSTPYDGIMLKTLKKNTEFYYNCNRYVKHVYDRAVKKYICLSDYEVLTLSGDTIVLTDRVSR